MLCKVKGCEGQVVSRKRCAKHIDGHFRFTNNKDARWDEGAPEGNKRATRICVVEQLLPDYAELAKVLTPSQIAEKIGANADTVRRFLKREGIDMMRWCKKCRENRHESEFAGPARRSCNRHEEVRRPNKHTEREWDDRMWESVREDLGRISCWIATEQGAPNGPYRAIDGGY